MNDSITVRPALQAILGVLPLRQLGIPEAAKHALLDEMHAQLLRIGMDALAARKSRRPFADAAEDRENFPFLRRFHLGVTDILQMTIPRELVPFFEQLLAAPPVSPMLLESVVRAALSKSTAPAEAALLQFLVYECLRLNLVVAAWLNESEFAAAGARTCDINQIAEQELEKLLAVAESLEPEVRPFQTLFAMGMESLLRHVGELKTALVSIKQEVDAPVRLEVLQAKYEGFLRSLSLTDAVLLGNRDAAVFDEQRIPLELLQQEHPLALEGMSREAMDQRVKRLSDSIESRHQALERRGTAMIDLVDNHLRKVSRP